MLVVNNKISIFLMIIKTVIRRCVLKMRMVWHFLMRMGKKQKEKLNVKTVRFDRVVDNVVEFRISRKLKTATLQEDEIKGRQPVAQNSHCSRKITSTAVQAKYEKNPQEIEIPKTLNDDMSALLPSSALFSPTRWICQYSSK